MTPAREAVARSTPGHRPDARLRFKATVELLDHPSGDIYLLAGAHRHLKLTSPSREHRALVALLHDPAGRPPDVLSAATSDAPAIVAQLWDLGLLEDAHDDARLGLDARAIERFDRQLRYFADAAPDRPRAALQRALLDAHVVVLGVGGLGSWVAMALAGAGIGTLTLCDGDAVTWSNLHRQALYTEADIDERKTRAAAEALRRRSAATTVHARDGELTCESDVAAAVAGADLVLHLADHPAGEIDEWVDAACFTAGIPYLTAGQHPPTVRIGPLHVPGRTACHACVVQELRAGYPLYDLVAKRSAERRSPAATYGPASALIGALLANEAINLLTGMTTPATLGASLEVHLHTLEQTRTTLSRSPGCRRCSDAAGESRKS